MVFSCISKGNEVTESMLEDEGVQRIIEGYFEVLKNFRELEFGGKIEKAANARMRGYENMVIEK